MSLSWEAPNQWNRSIRFMLGAATIWPLVYIPLFIFGVFSMVLFLPSDENGRRRQDIDLIQLEQKILDGQLKQLTIRDNEIISYDRIGNESYQTWVRSQDTRNRILEEARGMDERTGRARVDRIEEEPTPKPPLFIPIGFAGVFVVHMLTIFLSMALIPVYIVLVVKSPGMDQTARIVWVILLCMMGMLAMPVYWYLYIWRKVPPKFAQLGPSSQRPATEEVRSESSYVPPAEPPDWR